MSTSMRIAVKPSLLRWACDRSGRSDAYFINRFSQLAAWLSGTTQPTFNQLQDFAKAPYGWPLNTP